MMDFSRIEAVQKRISDIETKVGMRRQKPESMQQPSFDQLLNTEMKKGKTSPAITDAETERAGTAAFTEYNALIMQAAAKYDVDPKLVSAVAETESDFSQDARSEVGAIGVMQLMPDTAASLGVNPYDAKENIEGGTHYLRQMLDTFGGDIQKAVAAYNAGPQAVKDYGGVPPYKETIGYVNKVLDLYK